MDFLARIRGLVFVVPVRFQGFASVADVVVVYFEPAHIVIPTGNVRGKTTTGADRFQVFRVCDLHDLVLVAVPPVVFSYAQKHGDGDTTIPRCLHQI